MANSGVAFWKDGRPYDAQGRPIQGYQGPPQSTPDQNKSVVVDGQERGKSYTTGLPFSIYGSMPGEDQYYKQQIGEAQRQIYASLPAEKAALFEQLALRGMGQGTTLKEALGGLFAQKGSQVESAISDINAQRFQDRRARIMAYLNYLYQSKLQKQAKGSSLMGSLFEIGQALPYVPWGKLFPGTAEARQNMPAGGMPSRPPFGPQP